MGCYHSDLEVSARVEQVSRLVTQKIEMMAEAGDCGPLRSKRKAITTLLPYAVWRERDGHPEMLDTVLHAIRASRMSEFAWCHVSQSVNALLSGASPRAILLVSPHVPWSRLRYRGDLVQRWTAAASTIPHTEEVSRSAVGALLQIASDDLLSPYITADIWSWLTTRPTLPPVCLGRRPGTHALVVKTVRALKDIEVLKSYLLLVWSQWNEVSSSSSDSTSGCRLPTTAHIESCGFCAMRASIREDFGGVGMGQHRADLLHRLDHVLGQLDRRAVYLKHHDPEFDAGDLQGRKDQYRGLREALLGTDINSIGRTSHLTVVPHCMLSFTPGCTQDPAQHLCVHSLFRVCSIKAGRFDTHAPYFVRASASISSTQLVPSDALLS